MWIQKNTSVIETGQERHRGKTRNVECDKSYGENCEKPDMSPEDFKIEARTFLEQLAKTEGEIQEIQTQTKNQRESDIWYLERRNRLTASTFGEVCKRRNTTSCKSLVERIRCPRPFYARSIEWGIKNEKLTIEQLEKVIGRKTEPCSLFIDPELPYLAARFS
ncbi:hypothetical protein ILUMI_15319 [Ignelater luminosus]|uniref:YqaJ viral recombinase domain-containing protein n=1 Tax=Ignelater luminosus TaxID=2038154 RepID=A0A8K0CQQ7_IGNLU|nr:hypothetical protein ILUMI_15319 [Ignelater luminosus]